MASGCFRVEMTTVSSAGVAVFDASPAIKFRSMTAPITPGASALSSSINELRAAIASSDGFESARRCQHGLGQQQRIPCSPSPPPPQ